MGVPNCYPIPRQGTLLGYTGLFTRWEGCTIGATLTGVHYPNMGRDVFTLKKVCLSWNGIVDHSTERMHFYDVEMIKRE